MGFKVIRINSYTEYCDFINHQNSLVKSDGETLLFRGQRRDWALKSSLLRCLEKAGLTESYYEIERVLNQSFFNELIQRRPETVKLSDLEKLVIAQHHGLPTKLLDWSGNAFVALWFAFQEFDSGSQNRTVYRLIADELYGDNHYSPELNDTRFITAFKSPAFDSRIISQEAWLTIHNAEIRRQFDRNKGDGLPHFSDHKIINEKSEFKYRLVKIILPSSIREEVLLKLEEININHKTMFPDLSGLTNYLKERFLKG